MCVGRSLGSFSLPLNDSMSKMTMTVADAR